MSATHNVARPRRSLRAPRVPIVAQFLPRRGRASRERRAFVRERAGVVLEDSSKGCESDAEAEDVFGDGFDATPEAADSIHMYPDVQKN